MPSAAQPGSRCVRAWVTDLRTGLVVVALLAGCASQIAAPPEARTAGAANPQDAYYRRLAAEGRPVYGVDPGRSLVVIEVRRGGTLAHLGHDHVVASHDVGGYVAPDEGRADFHVPLDALVVDEPALRAESGFTTQPAPEDIAGTRNNMLQKVLETDRYRFALVTVDNRMAGRGMQPLPVAITLHGVTRSIDVLAQVDRSGEEISVAGSAAIDQSWFGITPFSVLGGAIAVQDRLNITFRIRARRID